MKKILITGANSYVGSNVEKWLMKEPDKYYVQTLDMKDSNWKEFDFSKFDVVFHVAGIAHINESKKNKHLYYEINRDLAFKVAKLSKKNNIKHFIFMSSMSVYGQDEGEINAFTNIKPKSHYGLSKYEAEKKITFLEDNDFLVTIVRPPMIYGPFCKGNYNSLRRFVLKSFIFPNIKNVRSFIYIDNFSWFIKQIVDQSINGLFHPYNSINVSTTDLVKTIAKYNKHKIYTKISLTFILKFIPLKKVRKISNNLYYNFPKDKVDYLNFDETIKLSEENWSEE
jgi:nucleoside-diphosphate-sugar epimerase